jgi:hypothetical protein
VGGSVASSIFGVPRATQDVDVVAALAPAQVELLEPAFFVDSDSLRDAVRRRVFKVDLNSLRDELADA